MDAITSILESTSTVEYQLQKLKIPKQLWAHPETIKNLPDGESFCDRFAYADAKAACFDQVAFDLSQGVAVSAERYGGEGIGQNGGGGRCGNLNGVQLKGIGPNSLVGDHTNKVHSYGGLDARKAIVETLYTHIIGQLLPLGTVNIHGLILVGENSGFDGVEDCWGVIMVRDACVRPGHFLRAGSFIPRPEVKNSLLSDVGRVRRLYKELHGNFGGVNEFIKWIGKCLQNMAQQFSFALAARIAHGTVSPSNISIDGRWLDLPDAGFLGGAAGFSVKQEFYAEHQSVLNYFLEIIYSYGKYNQLSLNPAPLINYYNEQFDACFRHCVGYAFGVEIEGLPLITSEDWACVASTYFRALQAWKSILRDETLDRGCADPGGHDPVYALVIGSLLHCCNSSLAAETLDKASIPQQELACYLASFERIWAQYIEHMHNTYKLDDKSVLICSLLTALKRILWVEIFASDNLDKQVVNLCNSGSPFEVGPLIDDYLSIASWVFNSDRDKVILFKNPRVELWFSVADCHYCLKVDGSVSAYRGFEELYADLTSISHKEFQLKGHDFFRYFDMLNKIMSSVDVNSL